MIPGGPVTAVLDHLAIGTAALTDGWDLFGGVLGGTWVYGDDSPGFWWGQLRYAAGPKIEVLTPTGGPDAAFLERFLAVHGAGPHHFNFIVSDIVATLGRIWALGIEHDVSDLDGATRLFREALDGQLASGTEDAAELTWPGGRRLRLVRQAGLARGGALHHVRFTRAEGSFGAGDRERAAVLAKRLGVTVELAR